jgi:hypothetical protein
MNIRRSNSKKSHNNQSKFFQYPATTNLSQSGGKYESPEKQLTSKLRFPTYWIFAILVAVLVAVLVAAITMGGDMGNLSNFRWLSGWYAPLKNSIRIADEFSSKLPVTDLHEAPLRGADSNLHRYKPQHQGERIPDKDISQSVGAELRTRVAFVSLIRNPIDLPLWLKYHRKLGIRRFFIRLEDSPSWEEYLKDMPDVVLEIGNSDKSGNNYSTLIDRQIKYTNETLKSARNMQDIEWLVHIDADELLHGNIGAFATLPKTVKTVKFENAEAIFDKTRQDTCFSATNFLRCSKNAPCKSYVNGKSAGRIHDPKVSLAGPHEFAYDGENTGSGDFRYEMPFETLHILHFEGCTFGAWVEKFFHLSKNDKGDNPFEYYKSSIEASKTAHKLYETQKMPNVNEFKKDQIYTLYTPAI